MKEKKCFSTLAQNFILASNKRNKFCDKILKAKAVNINTVLLVIKP